MEIFSFHVLHSYICNMKIIDQSYEITPLIDFNKQLQTIESCGRIAYQSEDAITPDSASKFVAMIKTRNHGAVLEHSTMSVKFITDRGISHELVRHRLASFTQESTRYCSYIKDKFDGQITVIRPPWTSKSLLGEWLIDEKNPDALVKRVWDSKAPLVESAWLTSMFQSENTYLLLLKKGWSPQQARSVLPNSLKTSIVVTANFREWLHIFQLRAIEKAAHPQMRDLMIPLYEECRKACPEIFNLGDPE